MNEREVYPVQQKINTHGNSGELPAGPYLAAYEVYKHVYGEQKAMVENGCRGGFEVGEIIAFLYARSFPKAEWSKRCDEAFRGMRLGRKP